MMSKISIIMPVYNGSQFLEKSIESVSNQTFGDVELICVDDGSTDDSLDVLNGLSEKYSFLKVFSQKNQGSGKARNAGMKKACGEYIAFLDADDIYIDGESLEKMYDVAQRNDANIVSSNLQFVEKNYTLKENPHYRLGDYKEFKEFGQIRPEDYGIPYAFYKSIFKREFLEKNDIDFPDLLRGQDPVFLAKVLANCGEVYVTPLNFYGYNYSIGGGVNVKINNFKKKESYFQHFKDTCDALSEGGLTDTSDVYKVHFAKYLHWRDNAQDRDLYILYDKIIGMDSDFFDKTDIHVQAFYIPCSAFHLYHSKSVEYYDRLKEEFKSMDVSENSILSEISLNIYSILVNSTSYEDFRKNYYDYTIERLENEKRKLENKNSELALKEKNLKEKTKELEKFNEDLYNSTSWKITKPLRAVMKIFKIK